MAISFPRYPIQENSMNPIYEALVKAGVKFVRDDDVVDGTSAAVAVLDACGFSAALERKDNGLQQAGGVEIKREYRYPVAMMEKVAQALGIDQEFADLKFLRLELESREGESPTLTICAGGQTQREARIEHLASLGLDERGLPLPKGRND